MNSFQPHLEILPKSQQQLWQQLKPVSELGFVLYGGTAIALQLGHRQSIDFDFFSEKKLDKDLLRTTFSFFKTAILLQDREETLTVLVPFENEVSVKISFFGNLQFGCVDVPRQTDDGVLKVASLEDLMATKLKVLFQRVESKDYIDIAAMIQHGVSLSYGLASASLMFGSAFQPSECLKALIYFHGGDLELLTTETKNVLIHAVAALHDLPEVSLLSSSLSI
ncbi:MAG: nucleotidyl transferase AbiEii/AbiGii toxin family protein [Verrucomicrobiae bacterium]|nr:nucleotidyl transferase AbiEii/AbiGii toxin family protein [Verrucomicrobiae bacterium]